MHAVPLAVPEHFTVGALSFARPFAVAVGFELIIPYVDEFIFVDIPLMEIGADARTARNTSVGQHRSRIDPGVALEDRVAYFGLIITQEPFAAVADMYLSFLPAVTDKVQHPGELFVAEL